MTHLVQLLLLTHTFCIGLSNDFEQLALLGLLGLYVGLALSGLLLHLLQLSLRNMHWITVRYLQNTVILC